MALIESAAAFSQRCDELVSDESLKNGLRAAGVETFAQMAFAIGTPQTAPTAADMDRFAGNIFGANPTIGQTSTLRMLHFESSTLVVAHFKSQVASDSSEPQTKKLPVAEKQARLAEQKTRLTGFLIEGETQPSHSLIDLCATIAESNSIQWIAPSRCTKRDTEVQHLGKDKTGVVAVENSLLKLNQQQTTPPAECQSSIQLLYCLQRRGLAFDQIGLIGWDHHEKYTQYIMNAIQQEPPPGYGRVTVAQAIQADKALFTIMAREVTGSLKKKDADNLMPMSAALKRLMYDQRFMLHLLPVMTKQDNKAHSSTTPTRTTSRPEPTSHVSPAKKARAAKAKLQSKLPSELKGYSSKTADGTPICWAYNLASGCSQQVNGSPPRCKKGVHQCIKCGRTNHGLNTCRGGTTNWHSPDDEAVSPPVSPGSQSRPPAKSVATSSTARPEQYIFLEIFAGTAVLSKTMRRHGFQVLAVDKQLKRASGIKILQLDLGNKSDLQFLLQFVTDHASQICWVHFAPSCGTASRSRERRRPDLEAQGVHVPAPLRSDSYPDGLPNLSPDNAERVRLANLAYEATYIVAAHCLDLDICISIENPLNSLFWKTTWIVLLFQYTASQFQTIFAHCMHGGDRDKATLWWSNKDWFLPLTVECDKSHAHASWKPTLTLDRKIIFPTAGEAQYPQLLCDRLANLIMVALQLATPQLGLQTADLAQAPFRQSRKAHAGALVSFYSGEWTAIAPLRADLRRIPGISKKLEIVRRVISMWGDVRDRQLCVHPNIDVYTLNESAKVELVTFGINREPWDFVEQAIIAGHPRSWKIHLSDVFQGPIEATFAEDRAAVCGSRARALREWCALAKALTTKEEHLKQNMPRHVAEILAPKRVLLTEALLKRYNFPDKQLCNDMAQGFSLTGTQAPTGLFPSRLRAASLSVDSLKSLAKGINPGVISKVKAMRDDPLQDSVWEQTQVEVKAGWLIEESNGGDLQGKVVAPRFGLAQGDKVRMIDDLAACHYNSATGLTEKYVVHSVDTISAMLIAMLDENLRREQAGHAPVKLVARTWDLLSAYKQYAVSGVDFEWIAVCEPPMGKVHLYASKVLPFGAVGSVSAFLRTSAALHHLAAVGLQIPITAYFDDFFVVTPEGEEKHMTEAVECMFNLLGVGAAVDGKKSVPFGKTVKILGVEFNLDEFCNGFFTVGHTASRRDELAATLKGVLDKGELTPKEAERLRGRLLWFEAYIAGKGPNAAMKTLGARALGSSRGCSLDDDLKEALGVLLQTILNGKPVKTSRQLADTWILFTDGACEPGSSHPLTIGAVLISPGGHAVHFLSEFVPMDMSDYATLAALAEPPTDLVFGDFFFADSRHPIYEMEILPVLLSLKLWGHLFTNAQLVVYVDNEACRIALVKGSSSKPLAGHMVSEVVLLENLLQTRPWYGRVPSSSNCSDGPSRLDTKEVESWGAERTKVDWCMVSSLLRKKEVSCAIVFSSCGVLSNFVSSGWLRKVGLLISPFAWKKLPALLSRFWFVLFAFPWGCTFYDLRVIFIKYKYTTLRSPSYSPFYLVWFFLVNERVLARLSCWRSMVCP